ncbi:MAG: diguanylate cyclase [Ferrimicrobium sp.]
MQKILIVDDVPANIKILRELLVGDYQLFVGTNGKMAVEVAQARLPDLILMDVMMPEMDGITACSILRSGLTTSAIPVIFITAKGEVEDLVRGFGAGGVDYVTKPFHSAELNARVRTHLELKAAREQLLSYSRQIEDDNKQLEDQNGQLRWSVDQLSVAVMTDPLTGLHNRRYMIQMIKEAAVRFDRSRSVFSLVIADIDHFKLVNDKYGHECGDQVLKHVSNILSSLVREQDYVARWGGEEFLMLWPDTGSNGALILAERLRLAIAESSLLCQGIEINVTMTFGISEHNGRDKVDSTIIEADRALYRGKENGRNQVCLF